MILILVILLFISLMFNIKWYLELRQRRPGISTAKRRKNRYVIEARQWTDYPYQSGFIIKDSFKINTTGWKFYEDYNEAFEAFQELENNHRLAEMQNKGIE